MISSDGRIRLPVARPGSGYAPHHFCKRCGKQIHFVQTERGKMMPCDLDLVQGDGRRTLIKEGWTNGHND